MSELLESLSNPWRDIADVVLSGVVLFAVLLAGLRIVGNRALATMNASDFIITVAIGTTFASAMVSGSVPLVRGLAGIVTLLTVQALTVWVSVKVPGLRRAAKGSPIVLFRDGQPQRDRMERARVSDVELDQAVREKGYGSLDQIELIILEADGNFSVIPADQAGGDNAARDVVRSAGRRSPT